MDNHRLQLDLVYDESAKGSRRATALPLFQQFCLDNAAHFRDVYGIEWGPKKPGTAGDLFREFREYHLKEGLRAFRASQLGLEVNDVEETVFNTKHQDTLKHGESKKGARGIEHWRFAPKQAPVVHIDTAAPPNQVVKQTADVAAYDSEVESAQLLLCIAESKTASETERSPAPSDTDDVSNRGSGTGRAAQEAIQARPLGVGGGDKRVCRTSAGSCRSGRIC